MNVWLSEKEKENNKGSEVGKDANHVNFWKSVHLEENTLTTVKAGVTTKAAPLSIPLCSETAIGNQHTNP